MKVGGGLNYVTGPMGAGKSLYGVRRITEYLCGGRYVVTNVRLYDDAPERIAAHVLRSGVVRGEKRQRIADKLRALYVYEESLEAAMRYRVPGRGEARALFVWDETHNDLNNRDWNKDGRKEILRWATQLRKLGFVGFLLSQHSDNTDAAMRRVCNWQIRLQNQKEQTRFMGVRVSPVPLFLARWYATNIPDGSRANAEKVERYFLSWHKNLYDTHDLYSGLADDVEDGSVVWLPEGGRTETGVGGGRPAGVAPEPVEVGSLAGPLGRIAAVTAQVEPSRGVR